MAQRVTVNVLFTPTTGTRKKETGKKQTIKEFLLASLIATDRVVVYIVHV